VVFIDLYERKVTDNKYYAFEVTYKFQLAHLLVKNCDQLFALFSQLIKGILLF